MKLRENERLSNEMEAICSQYRTRMVAGVEEIDRERAAFHDWQERKTREQRRISAACPGVAGCSSREQDSLK